MRLHHGCASLGNPRARPPHSVPLHRKEQLHLALAYLRHQIVCWWKKNRKTESENLVCELPFSWVWILQEHDLMDWSQSRFCCGLDAAAGINPQSWSWHTGEGFQLVGLKGLRTSLRWTETKSFFKARTWGKNGDLQEVIAKTALLKYVPWPWNCSLSHTQDILVIFSCF